MFLVDRPCPLGISQLTCLIVPGTLPSRHLKPHHCRTTLTCNHPNLPNLPQSYFSNLSCPQLQIKPKYLPPLCILFTHMFPSLHLSCTHISPQIGNPPPPILSLSLSLPQHRKPALELMAISSALIKTPEASSSTHPNSRWVSCLSLCTVKNQKN